MIRFIGDASAKAETNCVALHIIPAPEGEIELVVGGRYLDRLVKREDRWRIAERLYVMDWNRSGPATMQQEGGLFDGCGGMGAVGRMILRQRGGSELTLLQDDATLSVFTPRHRPRPRQKGR